MAERRISRLIGRRTSVFSSPMPETQQTPSADDKEILMDRDDVKQLATPGESKYNGDSANDVTNDDTLL